MRQLFLADRALCRQVGCDAWDGGIPRVGAVAGSVGVDPGLGSARRQPAGGNPVVADFVEMSQRRSGQLLGAGCCWAARGTARVRRDGAGPDT